MPPPSILLEVDVNGAAVDTSRELPTRAMQNRTMAGSWRISRALMLGIVTGSTAFGLGAPLPRTGLAAVLGVFLSLSGFLLDDYVDRERDRDAGVTRNPVAARAIAPRVSLLVCGLSFAAATVLALLLEPWTLLPACGVVVLVLLPALGIAGGPLARAVTLGMLQALYATIGGLVAGSRGPALPFIALFLLFAMTGGRVLGDVRDMPADESSGLATIPIRYGMRVAGVFLIVNELIAYACSAIAWAVGSLGTGYLVCLVAMALTGTVIDVRFLANPTSERADIANRLSLGLLGGLYTVGMVLAGM